VIGFIVMFTSLFPSFLPPSHRSFFQLDKITGTLKETSIVRPVHTEKGQADNKYYYVASVVRVTSSTLDPNISYRARGFLSFPYLLKEESGRVFRIRSRLFLSHPFQIIRLESVASALIIVLNYIGALK